MGTWEPSLTPPSSCHPTPLTHTHTHPTIREGGGAQTARQVAQWGSGPTMWLMNTNPVSQLLERAVSRGFLALTQVSPRLLRKKSVHQRVLSGFLPDGFLGTLPHGHCSLQAVLLPQGPLLVPSYHSQSDTSEAKATPSKSLAGCEVTPICKEQTEGPLEKWTPNHAKQLPYEIISKQPHDVISLLHHHGKKPWNHVVIHAVKG